MEQKPAASARAAKDTAAALAVVDVPVASRSETAAAVRARLEAQQYDLIDPVLVIGRDGRLAGVIALRTLFSAAAQAPLAQLLRTDWPVVRSTTDQEHAVEMARKARVPALPVVDASGRPLGCIPPERLLEIQSREHHEDVHRFVGMLRNHSAERALESAPLSRVKLRLPWLLIGLILSTFGTALMASFEEALKANVAIAFYIPALVYLTDAIGTQTEAVAVRGFSLRDWPIRRTLLLETVTGGLIGLTLGAIAFAAVALSTGNPRMAFGVGLTLLAAGTLASTLGLLLPWALARFGVDPAFGSGPVATILQDVLTLLIYFHIMTRVLA